MKSWGSQNPGAPMNCTHNTPGNCATGHWYLVIIQQLLDYYLSDGDIHTTRIADVVVCSMF